MDQIIDKTFNLVRSVLLGIAVAFLIVPYTNMSVYAHDDPREQPGDMDGDDIDNQTDVCVEDSYKQDYHEFCLEAAGFELYHEPIIENEGARKIARNRGWIDGEKASYQNLKIKTCSDLENYKNRHKSDVRDLKSFKRWVRWIGIVVIAILIGTGVGGTGVIYMALLAMLDHFIEGRNVTIDSAENAYRQLCTPQYRF